MRPNGIHSRGSVRRAAVIIFVKAEVNKIIAIQSVRLQLVVGSLCVHLNDGEWNRIARLETKRRRRRRRRKSDYHILQLALRPSTRLAVSAQLSVESQFNIEGCVRARRDRTTEECKHRKQQIGGSALLSRSRLKLLQ